MMWLIIFRIVHKKPSLDDSGFNNMADSVLNCGEYFLSGYMFTF